MTALRNAAQQALEALGFAIKMATRPERAEGMYVPAAKALIAAMALPDAQPVIAPAPVKLTDDEIEIGWVKAKTSGNYRGSFNGWNQAARWAESAIQEKQRSES